MASDNNFPEVVGNLRKARKIWPCLSRILGRGVASPRVSGVFFKDVVQSVIIFGEETWVMNPRIGRALGGFSIGSRNGSQGGIPGGYWVGYGDTLH